LFLIVAVGLATLAVWFIPHAMNKELLLTACFDDASGLRPNALVRVAGVDVGTVSQVQALPGQKDCPAEAQLAIATSYELKIPDDAIARIETQGVLGPTFVNIDVHRATGGPIKNHGILKTAPTVDGSKAMELLLHQAVKDADGPRATKPRDPFKATVPSKRSRP
jgi:ABC-type transporter Mla subunit MlaD